jgi:hypothetical protein
MFNPPCIKAILKASLCGEIFSKSIIPNIAAIQPRAAPAIPLRKDENAYGESL